MSLPTNNLSGNQSLNQAQMLADVFLKDSQCHLEPVWSVFNTIMEELRKATPNGNVALADQQKIFKQSTTDATSKAREYLVDSFAQRVISKLNQAEQKEMVEKNKFQQSISVELAKKIKSLFSKENQEIYITVKNKLYSFMTSKEWLSKLVVVCNNHGLELNVSNIDLNNSIETITKGISNL